jgi:hypothetical protein
MPKKKTILEKLTPITKYFNVAPKIGKSNKENVSANIDNEEEIQVIKEVSKVTYIFFKLIYKINVTYHIFSHLTGKTHYLS